MRTGTFTVQRKNKRACLQHQKITNEQRIRFGLQIWLSNLKQRTKHIFGKQLEQKINNTQNIFRCEIILTARISTYCNQLIKQRLWHQKIQHRGPTRKQTAKTLGLFSLDRIPLRRYLTIYNTEVQRSVNRRHTGTFFKKLGFPRVLWRSPVFVKQN